MSKSKGIMAKLFGGKGKEKAPSAPEAIQRLRDVEEMLLKRSDFLEQQMDSELEKAKKFGTKNKRAALKALKCKKRLEKQLQQIDGTLSTIELQRETLENASAQTEVFLVMREAARAMEAVHNDLDVDKIHDLMDDVSEQHQLSEELANAFVTPGFGQDYDEDELLAELEQMEENDISTRLTDELVDVGGPESLTMELPSVPSTEPSRSVPKAARAEDDGDWQELAAWAS